MFAGIVATVVQDTDPGSRRSRTTFRSETGFARSRS